MAVVGIAVGGFLIGSSLYVSAITMTYPTPTIPEISPQEPEEEPVQKLPVEREQPVEQEPLREIVPEVIGDHVAAEQLRSRVDDFYDAFGSKDINELLTFYSKSDVYAQWTGQSKVFNGIYPGWNNVRLLFASVLGTTLSIQPTIREYSASFIGDQATVTYRLNATGVGKMIGEFEFETDVITQWRYVDGQWLIEDDRWEFIFFKQENVSEGTVFPLHWKERGDFSVWDGRIAKLLAP